MTAITKFSPFHRALLALLLTLAVAAASLAASVPAGAQSLLQPPVTKEQAEEAAKEAEESSATTSGSDDGSLTWMLIGLGLLVVGGATAYIMRDAGSTVGPERERARKPIDSGSVRGAPKALFTDDAAPGGKVGKRTKRERGKRQRQARKAARK